MSERKDGAEEYLAAVERLEAIAGEPLAAWLNRALPGNPYPERALTNLERWVRSTSSPALHLQQVVGMARQGSQLLAILGASQPIADALIQNPELASLVLEPGEMARIPTRETIVREGRRLLATSSSYTHALDRLRYLKQRWNLPLAINDLSGAWPQPTVWRVLSDLADALIELARDRVWEESAKQRGLEPECPVLVVGFGKLGGHELNYSSDVDLVYVLSDGADERLEREVGRYCEALGRALSDRMGRGSLFRVDLRLRPYGGAGPIVRSMRSVEAYYQLYAEPWEVQALLRSRPIAGPAGLAERWEKMRSQHCFRPRLSDVALEHMLAMRARIEEGASEGDLKRGVGGIRDVEFLTQVLQMLYGHGRPDLQVLPTVDALKALDEHGVLDPSVVPSLLAGYEFLRKLEHRLQLVGDRQTHELPSDAPSRERLARSMGEPSWAGLEFHLNRHRQTVGSLYRATFLPDADDSTPRSRVVRQLGGCGPAVAQWFDVLPEADAFYTGLEENESSLARVRRLVLAAPKLVSAFRDSVPLTEMLMSGEIEEPDDTGERLRRLPLDSPLPTVAAAYRTAYVSAGARFALGARDPLPAELTDLVDALLVHVRGRLGISFDMVALGSLGACEVGPGSDADLLLLTPDKASHPKAEGQAQEFLSMVASLRRFGVDLEVDLRLRPEGRKGLLVRTYEGLAAYSAEGMELWERFALGQARAVAACSEAMDLVAACAAARPIGDEELDELLAMKSRIENERVQPNDLDRQVKLGHGGLNDIEWWLRLHEMRHLRKSDSDRAVGTVERVLRLVEQGVARAEEAETMVEAHRFLLAIRAALDLQGIGQDRIPENQDKLARLADALGFGDGPALLAEHRLQAGRVRAIYGASLERLKG